jgi:2,4-dienoyl-CoA reductase (NADPH2)
MAAGALRTPEQAGKALELGLSMVAVGKGLVMNQDWVALAKSGNDVAIRQTLDADRRDELAIPEGLWRAVEASPGWIPVSCSSQA